MDTPLTPCPDENALLAMMDGLLDEPARDQIEAHLDQCSACAELMIALGHLGPALEPAALGMAETTEQPAIERPTRPRLGRYILGQLLGMGGMGAVYEGFDPSLRRRVAIKILRPDLRADPDHAQAQRARHKREARALALLKHPHVLTVFDLGEEDDGRIWFAMELVDGQNIPDWIAQAHPDWHQIVEIYLNIARGLEAAHLAGVLHRDIKPHNMMVQRDGRAVLVDFGLANASDPALLHSTWAGRPPELTSAGIVVGTPYYMAPEQLSGQHIDARADQFSWCVSLYESLYGARPFIASSLESLLSQLQSATLTRPRGDQIPASIFDVLVKGLSPRPDERYADLGELILAMEDAARQINPADKPRPRQSLTLGLILGACVITGATTLTWTSLKSRPQTDQAVQLEPAKPDPKLEPKPASAQRSPAQARDALDASAKALALALDGALAAASREAAKSTSPKPARTVARGANASSKDDPPKTAPSTGAASPPQGASPPGLNVTAVATSPSPPVEHGPDFTEDDRAFAKALFQNLNSRWILACMATSSFATCRGALNEFNRAIRPHGGAVATLIYLRDKGANPGSLKITSSLISAFLLNAHERAAEAKECAMALELFIEFQRVHADIVVPKSDFHHKSSRDRAGLAKLLSSKFPDCEGTL